MGKLFINIIKGASNALDFMRSTYKVVRIVGAAVKALETFVNELKDIENEKDRKQQDNKA